MAKHNILTVNPTAEKAKLQLWDFIGKPEDPDEESWTGYSEREIRVLQNTNVKLSRMLSRSKTKFRIFFVLDQQAGVDISKWEGEGPVPYSRVSRELKSNDLEVPENDRTSVNVLLTGMGEAFREKENLPPTPWIIVHWIAHGIMKTGGAGTPGRTSVYDHIFLDFKDTLGYIYVSDDFALIDDKTILDFMHGIFQFRSARKRQLRNVYEGMHDALTEYIIRGDIRTNKPPADLDDLSLLKDEDVIVDNAMDDLMDKLKMHFDKRLAKAKGRWFVI